MNRYLTITNILIFLNILGFIIQNSIQNGDLIFGLNIYFFRFGLYYQLVSSMFVHANLSHILMNMFVLYQSGNMVESAIGKLKFLALYLVGGILTSIGSLAYMYSTLSWSNLVGASGAICVIIGFLAQKDISQRNGLIVWVLLISFAPLLLGFPVAWYAHLIGFAFGWLIAYVF